MKRRMAFCIQRGSLSSSWNYKTDLDAKPEQGEGLENITVVFKLMKKIVVGCQNLLIENNITQGFSSVFHLRLRLDPSNTLLK